jgi:hypothetical protein
MTEAQATQADQKKRRGRPAGWKKPALEATYKSTETVSRETTALVSQAKGYFVGELPNGRFQAFRAYLQNGQIVRTEPWVQDQREREWAEDDMLKLQYDDKVGGS